MKILCKIKEDATKKNSGWENVTLVAPLSIGNYLDKQLDERYISFYSKKEIYRVGAIVGIGYKKDGQTLTEWEYFILGRDSSAQSSFKKGVCFHQDAFLLEATKYLEGILCQSITFTNKNPNAAQSRACPPVAVPHDGTPAAPYGYTAVDYPLSDYMIERLSHLVITPVKKGDVYEAPSYNEVSQLIVSDPILKQNHNGIEVFYNNNETFAWVAVPGKMITMDEEADGDKRLSYTASSPCELKYRVYVKATRKNSLGQKYFYIFNLCYTQEIEVESKTIKKWTISSVVDRILDLAEPLFADGSGKPTPRFYLSSSGKFADYQNTIAPEFTLTECNLREQLQTVGGFIHAEPRATYDPTENAFNISFDDYGNTDEADLSGASLIERHDSMDISQYATEVKSNAQNLVNSLSAAAPLSDPAVNFFRSTRSESVYTRITDQNARVYTQYPIYSIEKVECGLCGDVDALTKKVKWLCEPVDITMFVYEKTEYDANLSSYHDSAGSKDYAIYYTQGSAGLDGLFYQAPNAINKAVYSPYAISNILAVCLKKAPSEIDKYFTESDAPHHVGELMFRVTYKPIYSETTSHGKSKYDPTLPKWQQVYNQSGNMIETTYYGENLKMTAAMLGNPEEERTYLLPSPENLPGVGKRLDGFAISAVKAEIYPRYTKATLALTRDFERISEFVGIDSVKRVYEVSEKEVYNRNVFLKSYIVIGKLPDNYESKILPTLPIGLDMNLLADGLSAGEQSPVSCVYATLIDKNGSELSRMMLPVVTSSFGNAMTFSFSYKDNYSAGERAEFVGGADDTEISGYWLNDVPYANILGRAEYLKASFFKEPKNAYTPALDYLTLPATSYTGELTNPTLYFRKPYLLEKDSREKISVHVNIEFKTESDGLILGSALAGMNGFVGGTLSDCYVSLLSRRCGNMQRYITATDKTGKKVKVTKNRRKSSTTGQTIAVSFTAIASSAFKNDDGTFPKNVGWAVYRAGSDGKEEILLACNQPLAEDESLFESGFTFYQMNA